MAQRIKMAQGVDWHIHRRDGAHAVFSDAGMDTLAGTGLDSALAHVNPHELGSHLGQEIGPRGADSIVREVEGRPDVVVKLNELPFSYSAINVALEHGFRDTRYQTPRYLGIMALESPRGGAQTATIMSRVAGAPLSASLTGHDTSERERFMDGVKLAQEASLSRAGISPDMLHMDRNLNNYFTARRVANFAEAARSPLVVLDQMAQHRLGVDDWQHVVGGFQRDERDIAAEQAADNAWSRFETSHMAGI